MAFRRRFANNNNNDDPESQQQFDPILKSSLKKSSSRLSIYYVLIGFVSLSIWLAILLFRANQRENQRVAEAIQHLNLPLDHIPVLVPVCDRPEYLEQVLEAFENAKGIDQVLFVFSQDCQDSKIGDLIRNLKRPGKNNVLLIPHERPFLGIPSYIKDNEYATSGNVNFLLRIAFDVLQAPAAIILESDVVPSYDFYEYFNWAYRNIAMNEKYNESLFTVNGFRMESRQNSDPLCFHKDGFMVWGWMMTQARWPVVKKEFTWFGNWDHQMQRIRMDHNWISVTPDLSRTKHIGMKGINFKVTDENAASIWARVYIEQSKSSLEYSDPLIQPQLYCN